MILHMLFANILYRQYDVAHAALRRICSPTYCTGNMILYILLSNTLLGQYEYHIAVHAVLHAVLKHIVRALVLVCTLLSYRIILYTVLHPSVLIARARIIRYEKKGYHASMIRLRGLVHRPGGTYLSNPRLRDESAQKSHHTLLPFCCCWWSWWWCRCCRGYRPCG